MCCVLILFKRAYIVQEKVATGTKPTLSDWSYNNLPSSSNVVGLWLFLLFCQHLCRPDQTIWLHSLVTVFVAGLHVVMMASKTGQDKVHNCNWLLIRKCDQDIAIERAFWAHIVGFFWKASSCRYRPCLSFILYSEARSQFNFSYGLPDPQP